MKRIIRIFITLCLATAGNGCKPQATENTLNEREYSLDEPLSSLSADGDTACWIGSETGIAWHVGQQGSRAYDLETDRIYDIYADAPTASGRICWVGVRNSGLQQWRLSGATMQHVASYPIAGKHLGYSVYDIHRAGSALYAGTSQGLYRLDAQGGGAVLRRIYPSGTQQGAPVPPFVVSSLCQSGRYLFAATQDGLLRVDTRSGSLQLSHRGEKISHVAVYGRRLYITGHNTLYIEQTDGKRLATLDLHFTPTASYMAGRTLYLIGINHIVLTENCRDFVTIPLHRTVPPTSHNVACFDAKGGYTLLLTENALWRIPYHLGVFAPATSVVAACSDGKENFYVNAKNELYRQAEPQAEAVKVYDIPAGEVVISMQARGGDVYYLNSNKEISRITVRGKLIENQLATRPERIYCPEAKVTAFHAGRLNADASLMVGIQDGMVAVRKGSADTIRPMDDKYVTAFYQPQSSGLIYLSTLNHGIYCGRGSDFKPIGATDRTPFIKDMIVTEGHRPDLIYTNGRHLMMNDSSDTLSVRGVNRLVYANDSVFYALAQSGISKYIIKDRRISEAGRYYNDIRFNPHAAFARGGSLYLGCDLGMLRIRVGKEGEAEWVKFDNNVLSIGGILLILGIATVLALVGWLAYAQHKSGSRRQLWLRIDDLKARLDELEATGRLLEQADDEVIAKLRETISSIDSEKADKKHVDATITAVSAEIMQCNRNAAMLLLRQLDRQTEEIRRLDYHDSKALAALAAEALGSGQIENVKRCMAANRQWLDNVKAINRMLAQYRHDLDGAYMLPGIMTGMDEALTSLHDALFSKPLAEVERQADALKLQYARITGPEALEAINAYIAESRDSLNALPPDKTAAALQSQLAAIGTEVHRQERIAFLKALHHFDLRLQQLRIRQRIGVCVREYTAVRNMVTAENERRVNKKFDVQLNAEIAQYTADYTEEIGQLIDRLYTCMEQTDPFIVHDLLKFSSLASQQAKVLAILMAVPKVKRTLLPGLLGIYGNLNPVISRLLNNKLKPDEEAWQTYAEKHPASCAAYIISLSE
jgi:hypothetical protein